MKLWYNPLKSDTIYTAVESQEELKPDTLRKSWHKLWPEVMIKTDQTENEQNNRTQKIVRDLQTLHKNIPASDVEEWIFGCDEDCETNEMTMRLLMLFCKWMKKL